MKTLYGLTNLHVYTTEDLNELNLFLIEYDGNIVDIQITDTQYHVVYRWRD
jgi:hypothetical protein